MCRVRTLHSTLIMSQKLNVQQTQLVKTTTNQTLRHIVKIHRLVRANDKHPLGMISELHSYAEYII
jgi:hypothetical protein